ncbi:MAG: nitrilase-related carbon-nitrogen hydrolase, partial [Pseudolabrys sp.]
MIEPYNAVGLIPSFWGIRRREEIKHNIEHLKGLTKAAFWLSNLDIPVRLLAIPEGALMGFNDEVLDVDHADYARTCCIDVPGPETDEIGKLARQWNVYIMAQAKARHKDWKDRFFNIGFIVDPDGKIILKHYKLSALLPVERSVSPHDLYDWWIKKYGRTLDAFWPVADTKIGRLGIMMAMEGNYPENGRGLAMNGAEVVYRASMPAPFTENDIFEISNRARALENNMYIVAPNIGSYHLDADHPVGIDAGGGQSMI